MQRCGLDGTKQQAAWNEALGTSDHEPGWLGWQSSFQGAMWIAMCAMGLRLLFTDALHHCTANIPTTTKAPGASLALMEFYSVVLSAGC
jgi:hypothetical protein